MKAACFGGWQLRLLPQSTIAEPNVINLLRIPILAASRGSLPLISKATSRSARFQTRGVHALQRVRAPVRLIIGDVESGAETLLLARPYPGMIGSLAWDPDGRSITFVGAKKDARPMRPSLFTVDIATHRVNAYPSPDWGGVGGLVWLPDGSGLLVTVWDKNQPASRSTSCPRQHHGEQITSDISIYGIDQRDLGLAPARRATLRRDGEYLAARQATSSRSGR